MVGFLIFLGGVSEWFADRSHAEYSFLMWAHEGLLEITSVTCSWKVTCIDMTARSESKNATFCFTLGVRCHLKASNARTFESFDSKLCSSFSVTCQFFLIHDSCSVVTIVSMLQSFSFYASCFNMITPVSSKFVIY